MKQRFLLRNHRSGDLLEILLVSAVSGLLGVRFFLYLSHYPQVGGRFLHIAHLVYGGALMLVAIVIMLGFLGYRMQRVAAVVGGLGFGVFIDELGKYVTKDNNYFFQPTVVVIYVVFVGLYFLFRWLSKQRKMTSNEYLMNALELLEESVLGDLDQAEQRKIIDYLERADQKDPITGALKHYAQSAPLVQPAFGWLVDLKYRFERSYGAIVRSLWFAKVIIAIFLIDAAVSLAEVAYTLIAPLLYHHSAKIITDSLGVLISTGIVAACVLAGAVVLRRNRFHAYEWFRRALLVDILLKQPFLFYNQQFRAVFGLALYVAGYATLTYMINHPRATTT